MTMDGYKRLGADLKRDGLCEEWQDKWQRARDKWIKLEYEPGINTQFGSPNPRNWIKRKEETKTERDDMHL